MTHETLIRAALSMPMELMSAVKYCKNGWTSVEFYNSKSMRHLWMEDQFIEIYNWMTEIEIIKRLDEIDEKRLAELHESVTKWKQS